MPVANAYWDGEQIIFGEGWGDALDITAHELTHAINDETAQLEYECQSGALSESMSDIFASNVDPDDWEIGEDLPGGALRDMADPGSYGIPRTSTTSSRRRTTAPPPPTTVASTPTAPSPTTPTT